MEIFQQRVENICVCVTAVMKSDNTIRGNLDFLGLSVIITQKVKIKR